MNNIKKIKCAVVGASGYAGLEVMRLISGHESAEVVFATSNTYSGKTVKSVFPSSPVNDSLTFTPHEDAASFDGADVFFLALPHGKSYDIAPAILEKAKIVDISADFRLCDASAYDKWYGYTHPLPDVLSSAVYGLTEIYRDKVRDARLVANPGCYPTSVGLALHGLNDFAGSIEGTIIIDSKSGYSGAGRTLKPHLLFSEGFGEFVPYAVTGHRHTSEMIQESAAALGKKLPVTFTPHLIPVSRGIVSVIYLPIKEKIEEKDARAALAEKYKNERFVVVAAGGDVPSVKKVAGTNLCMLNVFVDNEAGIMKAVSSIDNLVKGAAGQAVQNMNLMFGVEESAGLTMTPALP